MDQWLIRTAKNRISGPFNRDQVIAQIQDGKLGLQDELCLGNGYWFSLHEHLEVDAQLGFKIPRLAINGQDDEEVTETQIENPQGPTLEALPESPEQGDVAAPVQSLAPKPVPAVRVQGPQVMVASHIEGPSIWRGFAWALVVAACVLIVMVLRLLRQAGA